jgi:nitrate/TMAO reductase-like tetraheme cytochrome c subunit
MRRFFKPHVILIAFILFAASVPLQLQATSQPEFCLSCHEMHPMVATFQRSTHAAVGCMGCHTDPGYLNFVEHKIKSGFEDVYGHFFGYQKPIHTKVPNYRCLHCHPTIGTRNVFQQLEVQHRVHLAKGVACVTCHMKVGHQTFTIASPGNIGHVVTSFEQTHRKTTLDSCFAAGCHDNKAAKRTCVTCHVDQQRVKPPSHRPGWLAKHGALARVGARECLTCHKPEESPVAVLPSEQTPPRTVAADTDEGSAEGRQRLLQFIATVGPQPKAILPASAVGQAGSLPPARDGSTQRPAGQPAPAAADPAAFQELMGSQFCQSCHLKQNPHPKGFEREHGPSATATGANCATCHANRQQFCDSCHKTPMPHPANFAHQHAALVKSGTVNCQTCHQQRECANCHRTEKPATHTAAFVQQQHGAVSRTAGAQCQFCHEKRDCDGCHHTTHPASHTADWRAKHGPIAKGKQQDCLMCHRQTTCNTCHQLPMPHPAKYQAQHSADAKRSESACANCHKQSYCLKCHEKDEIHLPTAHLPGSGSQLAATFVDRENPAETHECPAMADRPQDLTQLRAFLTRVTKGSLGQ